MSPDLNPGDEPAMHPWNVSPDEARMLQESLAEDAKIEGDPEINTIAALDISVYPDSRIGVTSALLWDIDQSCAIEEVLLIDDLTFPYISGLLAFREAPLMLEAVLKLDREPDCLLVDGHGYAHPRRFGLASHLGLLMELPSIGCAKNNLIGEFDDPDDERGSHTTLWEGEPLGYCYRSMENAKPVFLSPGHNIDHRNIPELVEPLFDGRSRLPQPLQRAHEMALKQRRRVEAFASVYDDTEGTIYLVGGALRDLLMGERPQDYDLLVTEFDDEHRDKFMDNWGGSFVTLDEERSIFRITGGELEVDITVVDEDQIVNDLERRDFTVNSIALDLQTESWIDPTDGKNDIEDNLLRSTGSEQLKEDPLRILRAYRLAQRYQFNMADSLIEQCGDLASLLENVSRERVVEELLKCVSGDNSASGLESMQTHGNLREVPFFRLEGPRDIEILDGWQSPIERFIQPRTPGLVHGDYCLFDGLLAARMISKKQLRQWPFHRRIIQTTLSTHRGLSDTPEDGFYFESSLSLMGRLVGRGLWKRWDVVQVRQVIERLHEFLEQRRNIEKNVVSEFDDESDIAEHKQQRFQQELPKIWKRELGEFVQSGE